MAMTCPSCKRAFALESHPDGRCEEVNRGRRFFMMGALALPVAQKVTLTSPPVATRRAYVIYPDELMGMLVSVALGYNTWTVESFALAI